MSKRTRKPTIRAIEAAQTALHLRNAPQPVKAPSQSSTSRHASPASSVTSAGAAAAPVKRNGRAVNVRGAQAVAREQARNQAMLPEDEDEGEDSANADDDFGMQQAPQQDMTLYCICLGYDTGEQPMIQCEHCSNWFHFSCVGLNDEIAAKIEAYSCDMCEQMGMGATRLLADAGVGASSSIAFYAGANEDFEDAPSDEGPSDDEADETVEVEEGQDEDDEDEDEDAGAEVKKARSQKKRKTAARGTKRKSELASSDDDYDGEMADDAVPKKKKRPTKPAARRASTQDVKPSTSGPAASVPQSDKTRTHVVKQLTTIFSSIFSAAAGGSDGDSGSAGIEVRSAAFAEEVEVELFEGFAEVDDKGVRGPRAKYVSKFRSLHFNLKSNAYLRSRVANNELGAGKLIHLSAEDLQTPELRAMAESVRAASLRNSVKEVLAAPTAKRTHKGEEEIDNEASRIIAAEQAERAKEERDKMEVAQQKKKDERDHAAAALQSPLDAAFADSPYAAAGSPPRSQSPGLSRDSPAAPVRARGSLVPDGSPVPATHDEGTPTGHGSPGSPQQAGSPVPSANSRHSASNFDMSSIWTKAKAASPPVNAEEAPAAASEEPAPQSDDPFGLDAARAAESGDDDFEDELFRDPGASPRKARPAASRTPALDELPPIWAGDFIVPEEGGFPTFAVQLGGRPLGTAQETWRQLLPKGLTTAGRVPTATAKKYLIDCSLAPTRELVILALLPDLTGPSASFPHKPARDSCLAKHQHIVDQYVRRDRVGVVQPPRELGKLVKDIYVVPLRKGDDIPDYVELADEHVVPPSRERQNDLILAILVVQKGVLPTVKPSPLPAADAPPPPSAPPSAAGAPAPFSAAPPPFPAPLPSFPSSCGASPFPPQPPPPPSTQLPYSPAHVGYGSPVPPAQPSFGSPPPPPPGPAAAPGFDPAAMQSLLAQVNPETLNSLLANPSLLSGLPGFGGPGAQGPPPPQQSPPAAPRGPAVHPSRLALLGGAPPTGPAAMQQQPAPAPYGNAQSDGGWGTWQRGAGGQGYSPPPPPPGGGKYGY